MSDHNDVFTELLILLGILSVALARCRCPDIKVDTRDCPSSGYLCQGGSSSDIFHVSRDDGEYELSCKDPKATLFVNGRSSSQLFCKNVHWYEDSCRDKRAHSAVCGTQCTACKTGVSMAINGVYLPDSIGGAPCANFSCRPSDSVVGVTTMPGGTFSLTNVGLASTLICDGTGWKQTGGGAGTPATVYNSAICLDMTNQCTLCDPKTVQLNGGAFTGPPTQGTCLAMFVQCPTGKTNLALSSGLTTTAPAPLLQSLTCSSNNGWTDKNNAPVTTATCS